MLARTMRGLIARSTSKLKPKRSITPVAKFCITTSLTRTNSLTISMPRSLVKSTATLFLP